MMLAHRPAWVADCVAEGDRCFETYPDESLADWHARRT